MGALDLDQGVIDVRRNWDDKEGVIETKSCAGTRTVPIPAILRGHLLAHHLRHGRPTIGLVFGRTPTQPFSPSSLRLRALSAWRNASDGPLTRSASTSAVTQVVATRVRPLDGLRSPREPASFS